MVRTIYDYLVGCRPSCYSEQEAEVLTRAHGIETMYSATFTEFSEFLQETAYLLVLIHGEVSKGFSRLVNFILIGGFWDKLWQGSRLIESIDNSRVDSDMVYRLSQFCTGIFIDQSSRLLVLA